MIEKNDRTIAKFWKRIDKRLCFSGTLVLDFCFFRNVEDADDVDENKSGFSCRSGR
ncbi:hypothetical protein [Leptospira alexanderi]|uniref:hypothetical protein n=1 Tax=Leptospira alexanderi TaxID=100053 RepID=UPI0015920E34|nr:hypothetical protein [Leptospira alexanderi]